MSKFKIDFKYAKQRIKCDCGHYAKSHFTTEGCCNECGCTWYYPNYRWLKQQRVKFEKEVLANKKPSIKVLVDGEWVSPSKDLTDTLDAIEKGLDKNGQRDF